MANITPIALTGTIATEPRRATTARNDTVVSFRLAVTDRVFDQKSGRFIDGNTNWYTVSAFGQLAENAHESLSVGQRVNVIGALRIRDWKDGDKSGTSAEIRADAVGHDLLFGWSVFEKTSKPTGQRPQDADHIPAPQGAQPELDGVAPDATPGELVGAAQ